MARQNNDGLHGTKGFAQIEILAPVNPPPDPGPKPHDSSFSDWVRRDMAFKEFGTNREKFS